MPKPEILNVPPVEAVAHFWAKEYHVAFDWRDADAAEHVRSFTVAKAMKLDILQDIRGGLDAAVAEGRTFAQFRNELEPLLRKKGWWGKQLMTDPITGETKVVQLGSPRRLRIIFDTNVRMSYARGRWERIERLKGRMPYLRYVAVRDARTRPQHLAWHGTVLPVDHPFWQTHYPPNGWRCRCIVQQLSEEDLGRYGYKASPGPSAQTRPWTNKRTGEVLQVPRGIDPGFGHNVGRVGRGPTEEGLNRLVGKLDEAPEGLSRAVTQAMVRNRALTGHLAGKIDGNYPVAILEQKALRAIKGRSRTVRLSKYTADKQAGRIPENPGHPDLAPEDYQRVQRIFDKGRMFRSAEISRVAIGFLEENGKLWRVVVKETEDGKETYLETLHRAKGRDFRATIRDLEEIE